MANRVVRLTDVFRIEQATRADKVVLKLTGRASGEECRVEIALESYEPGQIANRLREGVRTHIDKWVKAQADLGFKP